MKKLFKGLFRSNYVKDALGVLDEVSHKFNNQAFNIIKNQIEKSVLAHPDKLKHALDNDMSTKVWVYALICNLSGDLVESGEYHIYRGVLNPMGPGEDLLKIFDESADELVRLGNTKIEYAQEQKAAIRNNIKNVG